MHGECMDEMHGELLVENSAVTTTMKEFQAADIRMREIWCKTVSYNKNRDEKSDNNCMWIATFNETQFN